MELVRPLAPVAEILKARSEIRDAIIAVLKPGTDIIRVPKAQNDSLSKAGAESVCFMFACRPTYEVVTSEVDHHCEVEWFDKNGGRRTSVGLYRFIVRCRIVRQDGLEVGEGIGSCSTLESKYVSRPRDCENTALKMAQKRAMVAAVLNGFGLSDRLTQDVEDFIEAEIVEPAARPTQAGDSRPNQRSRPAGGGPSSATSRTTGKAGPSTPTTTATPTAKTDEPPSRYASLSCMRADLSTSDFVCNVASDLDEALADGVSDTGAIDAIEQRWLSREQHIRNAELRTGVAAYIVMTRQQAMGERSVMPSDPDLAHAQSVGFAKLHELRKTRGRITTPPTTATHD